MISRSITARRARDSAATTKRPRPGQRERTLDALRGLAILGGLAVNVRTFASIDAARTNPTTWGDLDGLNLAVWAATYALVDGKFVCLFALVFGAGLVARAERLSSLGGDTAMSHYRRMAVLAMIGALHAYLLWWGDWLLILSVVGTLVYHYRVASARQLAITGLALYAVYPLLSVSLTLSLPWWPPETAEALRANWSPPADAIRAEIAAYQGSWLAQQHYRVPRAFAYQTSELALRFLWQVSGLMLLGMALYKLGFLRAAAPARHYRLMMAMGFGIGLPLSVYEIHRAFSHDWALLDYRLVIIPLSYWSSLAVTLGWVALVALACQQGRELPSLVAVGRLALSNYLLQTVVFTTIFYGHGLALFGRIDRAGQLAAVIGMWIVQVAASRLWLSRYDQGPVEWAWRAVAAALSPRGRS